MSIKDKIIFGLLIVLIIAGGYFQWMAEDMKTRMNVLNKQDQEHVDIVNKEFREDLRKLNLRFEGRGKHIRRAQQAIISNAELIKSKADSLGSLIDDVQYELYEYKRINDKNVGRVKADLSDLLDTFESQRRLNRRKFADLEQTLTAIQNQVNDLANPPENDKKKKKK